MMTRVSFSIASWILIFSVFTNTEVKACANDIFSILDTEVNIWDQRGPRVGRSENDLSCERPDFYICEVPPDVVSPESTKTCNYRNVNFQEQVYRWVAGRGCLFYTPNFLYVNGNNTINLNAGCFYGNLFAPCLEIPKSDGSCGCYPFDSGLEEVAEVVRQAIVPSAQGRWERCFRSASDCCTNVMGPVDHDFDEVYCPATFDAWTCWGATPNGSVVESVCSEFAYSNVGPTCNHFSSKECFENGTWVLQTEYSTCSITPRLLSRYRYHIGVLAFSIASCVPAVFVFFFYKRLRVTRVALHRNLLIAIIMRNIFVIISRSEIYIDELTSVGDTVMSNHGGWCQALAVAERIAGNAVFVCMLVEGIYLHRLIVAVFKRKLKIGLLYGIGVAITIIPVTAWAIVMGLLNDHSCWLVYTIDHIQWILDAPRLCILIINTVLFIDVLRVLVTKIRNAENVNQLNTTKVTLFLMPVFGTQFLLTAFRPSTDSCTGEEIYYYVTYTVEGLQGFIVALLYCYINKEVHNLVKATYKKTEEAVVSKVRQESNYRRSTVGFKTDRRVTFSTALDPGDDDKNERQVSINPKIQVAQLISIEATQRLADILEPEYESATDGFTNEGFDYSAENNPDFKTERTIETPSYSNDDQDNIRSENSNLDNINTYKYLDDNFSVIQNKLNIVDSGNEIDIKKSSNDENRPQDIKNGNNSGIPDIIEPVDFDPELFDEIIDYIENKEEDVVLDPNILSPNRKTDDKILFID